MQSRVSLNAGIKLSLRYLNRDFIKWRIENHVILSACVISVCLLVWVLVYCIVMCYMI